MILHTGLRARHSGTSLYITATNHWYGHGSPPTQAQSSFNGQLSPQTSVIPQQYVQSNTEYTHDGQYQNYPNNSRNYGGGGDNHAAQQHLNTATSQQYGPQQYGTEVPAETNPYQGSWPSYTQTQSPPLISPQQPNSHTLAPETYYHPTHSNHAPTAPGYQQLLTSNVPQDTSYAYQEQGPPPSGQYSQQWP